MDKSLPYFKPRRFRVRFHVYWDKTTGDLHSQKEHIEVRKFSSLVSMEPILKTILLLKNLKI